MFVLHKHTVTQCELPLELPRWCCVVACWLCVAVSALLLLWSCL